MSNVSQGFLLRRAKAGDERAQSALIESYTGLLVTIARELFAPGLTLDDLVQEARIGAHKAIRDFDLRRSDGTSFRNFLVLCAKRQVYTAVVAANRGKFGPVNERVVIDVPHGDNEFTLADVLPDPGPAPLEQLAVREDLARLRLMVNFELSDLEREALAGTLNGRSYKRTAELADVSTKQVDNALQRVRRKASEALAA